MQSPSNASQQEDSSLNPGESRTQADLSNTSSLNVTFRKREMDTHLFEPKHKDSDMFQSIKAELEALISGWMLKHSTRLDVLDRLTIDIGVIKTQTSQLQKIQEKLSDMEKVNELLHQEHESLKSSFEGLQREQASSLDCINLLEEKVEDLHKRIRSSSIEIRNVPKKEQENIVDIFLEICKCIQFECVPSTIKNAFRPAGKKNNNNIVVELSSPMLRSKFLQVFKRFNICNKDDRLSTRKISGFSESYPIFMSEYLTNKGKKLFYLAREISKSNDYRFCWVSNGNIFLRKDDKSPHILIKSEQQVEHLRSV